MVVLGVLGLILAFGDSVGLPGTRHRLSLPFSFLREIAPPFRAFRTVWRFSWLAVVAVAWWSAVGAEQIVARYPGRRRAWLAPSATLALLTLLALPAGIPNLKVDFSMQETVPALATGPVLSLPAPLYEYQEDRVEGAWLLRALEFGQPVTGGATGWVPPEIIALRARLNDCEEGRADPAELLSDMKDRGIVAAEIVQRPGDEVRTGFWREALEAFGAVPVTVAPRPSYRMYRLP